MALFEPSQPSTGVPSVIDFIATSSFEICALVLSHLDNSDLKALRLTNNTLASVVAPHLRFERVFISASPLNVAVFRAIAGHEIFRHRVREIVWDDARYETPPNLGPRPQHVLEETLPEEDNKRRDEEDDEGDDEGDDEKEGDDWRGPWPPPSVRFWFLRRCQDNFGYLEYRRFGDAWTLPQHVETDKKIGARLPLDVAFDHYLELLAQQDEVLSTSADLAAFDWALENNKFPNLKRITLTPAAHGVPFHPLYPTPAIRALPYGFNYPLPRGWPAEKPEERSPYADWDHEGSKDQWRGFLHVIKSLARQSDSRIQELIVGGTEVWSGLTCGLFHASEPCAEYDDLVSIIKKPGFTTLRLSLMVTSKEDNNHLALRTGRLRQALEADLRHFTLETDEEGSHKQTEYPPQWALDHFIPLRSIFPVEAWKNLAHFGLSRFLVKQQDLLDFLAALPQTLRSVELSFLWFPKGEGNHRDLLFGIRDELGWQRRAARPRLLIRHDTDRWMAGRAIWLESELDEFLYHGGDNPYVTYSVLGLPTIGPRNPVVRYGLGTEKDDFEPEFERPHVTQTELFQLGISKRRGRESLVEMD